MNKVRVDVYDTLIVVSIIGYAIVHEQGTYECANELAKLIGDKYFDVADYRNGIPLRSTRATY